MAPSHTFAPGWPGIPARWTSSAKTGVGTALGNNSRVWFTLSHGILNEVYYPRMDQACIRDMGFVVTDGNGYFSEEKHDTNSEIHWMSDGVPAFSMVNESRDGRYRIEKQILTDPHRNTVLQRVRFAAHQGTLSNYRLHVLLAPHLENHGAGNTGWVGEFEGREVLFAQRNGAALALASSVPWKKRSVGFVGTSDGWQDLKAHNKLTWEYQRAENGNIALVAEIDMSQSAGAFDLALGFGTNPEDAARSAIASLGDGFEKASRDYIAGWRGWKKSHATPAAAEPRPTGLFAISLAVLRTHESKSTSGGIIASLSIPWGFSKGDNDPGGYHLVWSRDMVEAAGGLLAAGAQADARRVLDYLQATQQPDGHWSQNMWLDGSPYWNGVQMDETALPILLVDLALREKALAKADISQFWPMVQRAAGYLVRNGPVSPQDRWEEDPGYTPFTIGAQIAALLAAADMADGNAETPIATYLREIADVWTASIDRWMYASNSDWGRQLGVAGYYVRIAPVDTFGASRFGSSVDVKNVGASEATRSVRHLVSPDALALVRFGLRAADDPRMSNSAIVIDAKLKTETPAGPVWHRYNDDGYGEHADGSPFDGTGIGRGWPLLTGERGHFELAAGRVEATSALLAAMESLANEGGMISEQVWDAADLPDLELHLGRPSGSAMPLVWAHAEYLKLRRSLADGQVFDLPRQTVKRYLVDKTDSPRLVWRFNHRIRSFPCGKLLRVETLAPAVVHWSADQWQTIEDTQTDNVGLGMHVVDLPTRALPEGSEVRFTFYWPEATRWESVNFAVTVRPTTEECRA